MAYKVFLTSEPRYDKALKLIAEIKADAAAGKDVESRLLKTVQTYTRPTIDSIVFSRILSLCHSYGHDLFVNIRDSIVKDTPSYNPNTVLTAIDYTLDDGDLETAKALLSNIPRAGNHSLQSYVSGRVSQMSGDTENAKRLYLESFRYDPYFPKIYEKLHSIDPEFGWDAVGNLMKIKQDPEAQDVLDVDGPMGDLLSIYAVWLDGDRASAMSLITSSPLFESGNPFYRLVHAWMCVSDGRYRKAVRSYLDAIEGFGGNVAFLSEVADILDRLGRSEESLIKCKKALDMDGLSDIATAQLAITQIHMGKIKEAVLTLDSLISLPIVDASLCARCITVLWDEGRKVEANSLHRKIHGRCSNPVYAAYLDAYNSNRNGDHRTAKKFSEAGKKVDSDNLLCICQHVIAMAGVGKVEEALSEIESKIPVFMNTQMLLDTKKDILISVGRYPEAIVCCDKILGEDPRNADVIRDKANAYRLSGNYPEAVSWYRESLNIREDIRLFQSVLKMLLDSRRTDDLCSLVDDYDDTYGSSATVWRIRGNAEYAAGRYDDAISSYTKASAIVSNDIDIWHSKGMAEEMAGRYSDAEASYDRAVILDLENIDCWISKATVQEIRGNIIGAIDSINRAISVSSDNVYALVTKGRLLARLGKYREAEFFLNLAYKLDASNTKVLEMILRILVHVGNLERAARIGNVVLERDSKNVRVMFMMSEIHAATGDTASAVKVLNDSRPFIGTDLSLLTRCADLYHNLACYQDELEVCREMVSKYPDSKECLLRLAEACSAAGNRDEAAEIYRTLETMVPEDSSISVKKAMVTAEEEIVQEVTEDVESLFAFAKTLVEGGNPSDAIPVLGKVLEECPDDPEMYLYAADVMLNNGAVENASDVIKQARAAFPSDARVIFLQGMIREATDDILGALSAYTDASKLGMATHELYVKTGGVQLSMSMLGPAVESYTEAVRTDPSDVESRMGLCRALSRMGRQSEAIPHLRLVIEKDPECIEALRMYVFEASKTMGSEAMLAVFDKILAAPRTEDDTEFFAGLYDYIGEHAKAEILRDDRVDMHGFDAEKASLDVMDLAYSENTDLSDIGVYEKLGLTESQTEAVLNIFSSASDYVPVPGTEEFSQMESFSYDCVVGENLTDIEESKTVPLQMVRHAVGSDLVSVLLAVRKHIECSFSVTDVALECRETVDKIVSEFTGTDGSVYGIMSHFGVGIMTARMVAMAVKDMPVVKVSEPQEEQIPVDVEETEEKTE